VPRRGTVKTSPSLRRMSMARSTVSRLGTVVLDLEFHLQIDLIGHVRDEPQVLSLDRDIIV
jgi:hypothetical protein